MKVRQVPSTFSVISLGLSSSDRGSAFPSKKVKLPLPTDALEIHLQLPEQQSPDTVNYRIQWEDTSGVLGDLETKSRDGESLVVFIPAAKLRPTQYVLNLFEIKRDGTERRVSGGYYFTAVEDARTR